MTFILCSIPRLNFKEAVWLFFDAPPERARIVTGPDVAALPPFLSAEFRGYS
jgi:hypothetical protein